MVNVALPSKGRACRVAVRFGRCTPLSGWRPRGVVCRVVGHGRAGPAAGCRALRVPVKVGHRVVRVRDLVVGERDRRRRGGDVAHSHPLQRRERLAGDQLRASGVAVCPVVVRSCPGIGASGRGRRRCLRRTSRVPFRGWQRLRVPCAPRCPHRTVSASPWVVVMSLACERRSGRGVLHAEHCHAREAVPVSTAVAGSANVVSDAETAGGRASRSPLFVPVRCQLVCPASLTHHRGDAEYDVVGRIRAERAAGAGAGVGRRGVDGRPRRAAEGCPAPRPGCRRSPR